MKRLKQKTILSIYGYCKERIFLPIYYRLWVTSDYNVYEIALSQRIIR